MTRKMYLLVFFSICQNFLLTASAFDVPDYFCDKDEEVINPHVYNQSVSDQGDLGICFIHSSLQTYTSLYEEIFGEKIEISPLYAALHVNSLGYKRHSIAKGAITRDEMLENVESGYYSYALRDFKRFTPCSAKAAEAFLRKLTQETSIQEQIQKATDFLELYDRQGKDLSIRALHEQYGFDENAALRFKNYLFTHGFEREKFHLHKKSYTKTLYKFFMNLGKCSEKKKLSYKIKSFTIPQYSIEQVISKIDQSLTKEKNYPIGLSYRPKNWTNQSKAGGNHSSLIYGKTCRNNQLYYLIRNSWGGKSLKEMRAESEGDFTRELTASQDIHGDFWIKANLLKKAWAEDYGGIHVLNLKKRLW